METKRFDALTRSLAHGLSRRGTLVRVAAILGSGIPAVHVTAGKKKKKVTICRSGQTLTVKKKKKQKHLQPGDTEGSCPPPAPPPGSPPGPPPGPPPLPPRCSGSTPNFCVRLDSCQPACPSGKVFDAEGCSCVCAQVTGCCTCDRGAESLCFSPIVSAAACAAACAAQGGTNPSFTGGNGSAAVCSTGTENTCTVTCTADPMTCPAGIDPDTCGSGFVCCSPEIGGGCCTVDLPFCCESFCCENASDVCCDIRCCPAELPVCCETICCAADSACCRGEFDCSAGKVCQMIGGNNVGCCVDAPERSTSGWDSPVTPLVHTAPPIPKRDASGRGRERSRRKHR